MRARLSHLWLRWLEWRFAQYHAHQFLPTGTVWRMGADLIEERACTQCSAKTWTDKETP
jgi:hypothetical protein